jgi:hypothetical protein
MLAKYGLADVASQCGINFLSMRNFIASWANGFDIDNQLLGCSYQASWIIPSLPSESELRRFYTETVPLTFVVAYAIPYSPGLAALALSVPRLISATSDIIP